MWWRRPTCSRWLDGRKLDAVIHMGAISDTTATDADLVMENNFRLSLRLLDWCTDARVPFIYASSAATYGDGGEGFNDDWSPAALQKLKPMNLYGWSKQLFDQAVAERFVKKEKLPPQWAGLKFFNVFGPNEYHKGEMMSLVAKRFDDAKAGRTVRLFKSHRPGIGDGEQRRDFIYVDDAVAVVRWLMETPQVSGIFNVGTGKARSFRDLISALFRALGREPKIEYVDMPDNIRGQYQYFTRGQGRSSAPRRLQRRLHLAGRRRQTLRHAVPRHRRPLSLKPGDHVRFRKTARRHRPADHPLHRRSDARRLRLWRRVAHLAGGAGAGDRGDAARTSSSAAPATWRATSPASARTACSSA